MSYSGVNKVDSADRALQTLSRPGVLLLAPNNPYYPAPLVPKVRRVSPTTSIPFLAVGVVLLLPSLNTEGRLDGKESEYLWYACCTTTGKHALDTAYNDARIGSPR